MNTLEILQLGICIYAIMRTVDHIEQLVNYLWKSHIGRHVEKDSGAITITLRDLNTGNPLTLSFENLSEYKNFINDHTKTFNKCRKEVQEEIEEMKNIGE